MGPLSEQASEFGVIGLTAAGQALALRLAERGNRVSLWDATFEAVEQFARTHMDTRGGIAGFEDLEDFFDSLAPPPRAACFLPPLSIPAGLAARLAGDGVHFIEGGGSTGAIVEADLDEIEASLIALPD